MVVLILIRFYLLRKSACQLQNIQRYAFSDDTIIVPEKRNLL